MSNTFTIYAKNYDDTFWEFYMIFENFDDFAKELRVACIKYDIVTADYRRP